MKAEGDRDQRQRWSLTRTREDYYQSLEAVVCVCLLVGSEGLYLNSAEYGHD